MFKTLLLQPILLKKVSNFEVKNYHIKRETALPFTQ